MFIQLKIYGLLCPKDVLDTYPHENKIYMRNIQLLATKIYFGVIEIYVKNILTNISHFCKENIYKIYFNYTIFENGTHNVFLNIKIEL